jgi:hypothetical protein
MMKPHVTPSGRRVYNDFVLFEKADYFPFGIHQRYWKALQNVLDDSVLKHGFNG